MKSEDVIAALQKTFTLPEWITAAELYNDLSNHMSNRIDFVAIHCQEGKKLARLAMEVKVSRSDFLAELKNPSKRLWAETYFHETWFVAPKGLIKPSELPEKWGLMVVTDEGKVRRVHQAVHRSDPKDFETRTWIALVRNISKHVAKLYEDTVRYDKTEYTVADFHELVKQRCIDELPDVEMGLKRATANLEKQLEFTRNHSEGIKRLLFLSNIGDGIPEYTTYEDVDRMIDNAVSKRLRRMMIELKQAHTTLQKVLDGLGD